MFFKSQHYTQYFIAKMSKLSIVKMLICKLANSQTQQALVKRWLDQFIISDKLMTPKK